MPEITQQGVLISVNIVGNSKLSGQLCAYFQIGYKIINITASFGLCTVTGVGEDYEKVINCADEKLYTAKRTGRNKVVF